MIRFICTNCKGCVQVAPEYGGKRGRCPFCKELILIPRQSDPSANGTAGSIEDPATDDLRALKAAVLKEEPPQPQRPVPPPPQSLPRIDDMQLDLGNGADATADMPAIQPIRPTLVKPERPAAPRIAPTPARRMNLTWIIFAVGLVVVLAAIGLILLTKRQ